MVPFLAPGITAHQQTPNAAPDLVGNSKQRAERTSRKGQRWKHVLKSLVFEAQGRSLETSKCYLEKKILGLDMLRSSLNKNNKENQIILGLLLQISHTMSKYPLTLKSKG